MTIVLVCSKEYDVKLCGRKLSDFALEKIKSMGGAIICASDNGASVSRAVKSAVSLPVLIYPVNIITAADPSEVVNACGNGCDMAVLSPKGERTHGIAALYRLPSGFDSTDSLYGAAEKDGFNIKTVYTDKYYIEIDSRESYLSAQNAILYKKYIPDVPYTDTELSPRYTVTRGPESGSPVYIGKSCVMGENVKISDGCYIGDNVYIGANSEIISSAVMDGAYVSGGSILKNTVVGENTSVSHGKTAENIVLGGSAVSYDPPHGKPSPMFGTDGIMTRDISAAAAFSAGQAVSGMNIACAYGGNSAPLAEAFAAGAASSGGSVTDFGELPENVFRYALKNSMCNCGIYFGDGYLRPWEGDGLPSGEELRSLLERAVRERDINYDNIPEKISGGIIRAGNIYNSYNSYLDKLTSADISGIFADVTTPDKRLYDICRDYTARHGADNRDNPRIAFHISGDGGRISAYTDETGYVFHDRLVMLCISESGKPSASVNSGFPHVSLRSGGKNIVLERYDYAPDYRRMTADEVKADKAARANADYALTDGAAIMAAVLSILSAKNITLEDAVSSLPKYSASSRIIPLKGGASEMLRRLGLPPRGGALQAERGKAYIRPLRTGGVILSAESASLEISSEICGFYEEILRSIQLRIEN